MTYISGRTRGGEAWTPHFVKSINMEKCIGCGRCMKVCARNVLVPRELDEEESVRMFATIKHPERCIGCEACGKTCTKKAFAFEPLEA